MPASEYILNRILLLSFSPNSRITDGPWNINSTLYLYPTPGRATVTRTTSTSPSSARCMQFYRHSITMTRLFITLTVFLIGCGMTNQKNTMTLDELLTKERAQYLATFQLGLDQHKTAKSAIEVMIQTTADQNRNLPELYQINRYDLININAEGKYDLTEFNLDKDSVLKF